MPGVSIETREFSGSVVVQAGFIFFFMPFASRFCIITQLSHYFWSADLKIPYYVSSIYAPFFCFSLFLCQWRSKGTHLYSGGNILLSLLFAPTYINPPSVSLLLKLPSRCCLRVFGGGGGRLKVVSEGWKNTDTVTLL